MHNISGRLGLRTLRFPICMYNISGFRSRPDATGLRTPSIPRPAYVRPVRLLTVSISEGSTQGDS